MEVRCVNWSERSPWAARAALKMGCVANEVATKFIVFFPLSFFLFSLSLFRVKLDGKCQKNYCHPSHPGGGGWHFYLLFREGGGKMKSGQNLLKWQEIWPENFPKFCPTFWTACLSSLSIASWSFLWWGRPCPSSCGKRSVRLFGEPSLLSGR